jgi:hypothetical protein
VLELVKRLPATASLREILRGIEFVVAVKEGLDEIDQGQGISIGCCARPVVDFFERLASRAFQKNQQQI